MVRDQVFYGQEGGVTFSGGEPLLQADFAAECARLCQEKGISVALDTSLFAPDDALEKVLPYADLFLIDCKAVTPSLHQKGTGQDNALIQKHTRLVAAKGKRYWIRIPLIPGFNDNQQEFEKMGMFLRDLPAPPQRVEIMPFHNFCITKYQSLGMDYAAKDLPIPPGEEIKAWENLLRDYGLKVQGK